MHIIAPAANAVDRPTCPDQPPRRWIYDFPDGFRQQRSLLYIPAEHAPEGLAEQVSSALERLEPRVGK